MHGRKSCYLSTCKMTLLWAYLFHVLLQTINRLLLNGCLLREKSLHIISGLVFSKIHGGTFGFSLSPQWRNEYQSHKSLKKDGGVHCDLWVHCVWLVRCEWWVCLYVEYVVTFGYVMYETLHMVYSCSLSIMLFPSISVYGRRGGGKSLISNPGADSGANPGADSGANPGAGSGAGSGAGRTQEEVLGKWLMI